MTQILTYQGKMDGNSMEKLEFYKKIAQIQEKIKVKKDNKNAFGNYNYRSVEDIFAEVKGNLDGLVLFADDEIVNFGDRYYIKSTVTITDGVNSIHNSAFAREELTKKGMDAAQITGGASSYARKYALAGLLLLENEKDSDATNDQKGGSTNYNRSYNDRPATDKQKDYAKKLGINFSDNITSSEISDLINKSKRIKHNTKVLDEILPNGIEPKGNSVEFKFDEAKSVIDEMTSTELEKNGKNIISATSYDDQSRLRDYALSALKVKKQNELVPAP